MSQKYFWRRLAGWTSFLQQFPSSSFFAFFWEKISSTCFLKLFSAFASVFRGTVFPTWFSAKNVRLDLYVKKCSKAQRRLLVNFEIRFYMARRRKNARAWRRKMLGREGAKCSGAKGAKCSGAPFVGAKAQSDGSVVSLQLLFFNSKCFRWFTATFLEEG